MEAQTIVNICMIAAVVILGIQVYRLGYYLTKTQEHMVEMAKFMLTNTIKENIENGGDIKDVEDIVNSGLKGSGMSVHIKEIKMKGKK